MDIGSFGFLRVPSSVPVVEDQIAVLRLLGRLEYTLTPQIRHLIYRDTPERTMYRRLEELHKAGYIWRQAVNLSPKRRNSNTPPERIGEAQRKALTPTKMPYVWGLTPEGKAYLEMTESEPEPEALAGLKTRDRRSPNVPLATLTHDLQASWWCSSVVAEATRNRFVTGIFLQVEFVTAKSQRVDALVGLRIDPNGRERDLAGVPWYDGFGDGKHEHWRWYALEIDRGTEPLAVLLQKAVTYRDLTMGGVYEKIVHGRVLPVFIAPTARRCHQIHQEWAYGWPEGYGAVATPQMADHKEHGVLWGNYWHIVKGEAIRIFPSMPLETWKGGIAPTTPAPAGPPAAPAAPRAASPSAPAGSTPAPAPAQRPPAPAAATTAPAAPAAPQRPPQTPPAPSGPSASQRPAAPASGPSQPQRGPSPSPTAPAPGAAVATRPAGTIQPPAAAPSAPRPAASSAAPAGRPTTPPPTSPASGQLGAAAHPTTPPPTSPAGTSADSPSGATSGAAAAGAPAPEKAPVRRRVVGFAAPKRQGNGS